jgi:hypothetical protein
MGKVSARQQGYCVTDEDLVEFVHNLQVPDRRPTLLFDALMDPRGHLLLIGTGFSGWLTRFFLRTIKANERLWTVRDQAGFVADTIARDDLTQFLEYFSEQTLVYEGDLVEFVDELVRRVNGPGGGDEPPAVGNAQAEGLPGPEQLPDEFPRHAVFISYASEDRDIARSIKEELEKDNIDVWFDRNELQRGDLWKRKIQVNIDECCLFLPILSRSVKVSGHREFLAEWEHALSLPWPREPDGSPARFIVPVLVDDTDLDDPAVSGYFRKYQAEKLPGGRTTSEFREFVKQRFRLAQKR